MEEGWRYVELIFVRVQLLFKSHLPLRHLAFHDVPCLGPAVVVLVVAAAFLAAAVVVASVLHPFAASVATRTLSFRAFLLLLQLEGSSYPMGPLDPCEKKT